MIASSGLKTVNETISVLALIDVSVVELAENQNNEEVAAVASNAAMPNDAAIGLRQRCLNLFNMNCVTLFGRLSGQSFHSDDELDVLAPGLCWDRDLADVRVSDTGAADRLLAAS